MANKRIRLLLAGWYYSQLAAAESDPLSATETPASPYTTDDFHYDSFTTFAPTESPYYVDHTASPTEDIIYYGSGYAFTSSPIGSGDGSGSGKGSGDGSTESPTEGPEIWFTTPSNQSEPNTETPTEDEPDQQPDTTVWPLIPTENATVYETDYAPWQYDSTEQVDDGHIAIFSYLLSYAGERSFYSAEIYKNGYILLPDLINSENSIKISPFQYNLGENQETQTAADEIYVETLDLVGLYNAGVFDHSIELQYYEDQTYGGYLFTWVYDLQGNQITSQILMLYDVEGSMLIEARKLHWSNLFGSLYQLNLAVFSGESSIIQTGVNCSTIYNAQDYQMDSHCAISVHDRTQFLECKDNFSSAYCINSAAPSNNPDINVDEDMTHIFVTGSGDFGEMAGLLTCPEGQHLVSTSDGSNSTYPYEIHSCLYDGDRYEAAWSTGNYVCVFCWVSKMLMENISFYYDLVTNLKKLKRR